MPITWLEAFADVAEPELQRTATFWQAITGCTAGSPHGLRDQFIPLAGADEDAYLWLQRTGRPSGAVSWHPDLLVTDLADEVRRARDLGAEVVREVPHLITLSTPGGQPFCLVSADGECRLPLARRWQDGQRSLLDQLCLDLPAAHFDCEAGFWQQLTGFELITEGASEFARLRTPAELPLRIVLQRLDDDSDAAGPSAHLDLACTDVASERARHLALGASTVRIAEHWTTLRDPAGLLYCITDRQPRGA
jgi:hypothetical protein